MNRAVETLLRCLLVLCAAGLAVLPTGAIFSDPGWRSPALIMVGLIVVSGGLVRLIPAVARLRLAPLVQLVVALVALPYLCTPHLLAGGILPGPAAYGAVVDQISEGREQVFHTVAPTATTAGFTTMVVLGFAVLVIVLDWCATDLRVPKPAAFIVLLAWLVPVFLAGGLVSTWHFVGAGVAFVLVLLTGYVGRIRVPLTALGAGALALLLGVGLPILLPDVPDTHRNRLGTGDLKVANPFLDLRKDLARQDDTPLLNYTTDAKTPEPVRMTAVADFDGRTWSPEDFTLRNDNAVTAGLPEPESTPAEQTTASRTTFTVRALTGNYLPTVYSPVAVEGAGEDWIYDPKTLAIVGHTGLRADQTYTVDSRTATPEPQELAAAGTADRTRFASELSLPDSLPESVTRTATRVTKDADSAWEKAARIQAYLRSDDFTYSLDAPAQASDSAIADFLRDKRGYCVQFSATMAVLARVEGIPARIAVGYTPGQPDDDGSYTITDRNAHAWPELYFPGSGWVRFEPTPGTGETPPPWTGAQPGDTGQRDEATPTPTAQASESAGGDESAPAVTEEAGPADSTGPAEAAEPDTSAGLPAWLLPCLAAVLVLLVLVLAPRTIRSIRRARRLRDPVDPEAVWSELMALLADYGRPADPAGTVAGATGILCDLTGSGQAATRAVERIGAAVEVSRYGRDSAEKVMDRSTARVAVAGVRAGLRSAAGWPTRFRAEWLRL